MLTLILWVLPILFESFCVFIHRYIYEKIRGKCTAAGTFQADEHRPAGLFGCSSQQSGAFDRTSNRWPGRQHDAGRHVKAYRSRMWTQTQLCASQLSPGSAERRDKGRRERRVLWRLRLLELNKPQLWVCICGITIYILCGSIEYSMCGYTLWWDFLQVELCVGVWGGSVSCDRS